MKWRKLGRVFAPDGRKTWMRSHAANPVPEARGGDIVRVYFSSRDDNNRAHERHTTSLHGFERQDSLTECAASRQCVIHGSVRNRFTWFLHTPAGSGLATAQ